MLRDNMDADDDDNDDDIVHQKLKQWTKILPHSNNILDVVIKVVPLCSVDQALSYVPNFTLPAWVLAKLAYLSMLFILEMTCTAGKNKQHAQISQAGCMRCW